MNKKAEIIECDTNFVVRVSGKLCVADSLECPKCGSASMGLKPPALGRFNWVCINEDTHELHIQCTNCKYKAEKDKFYDCSEWFGVGVPEGDRWPFRKRLLQYLRDEGIEFDEPYVLFAGNKASDLRRLEKAVYKHDHPVRTNKIVKFIKLFFLK